MDRLSWHEKKHLRVKTDRRDAFFVSEVLPLVGRQPLSKSTFCLSAIESPFMGRVQ